MTTALFTKELTAIETTGREMPWCDHLLAWADSQRGWLFAGLAVIYLLGLNGQWRIEPDSALYLSLARSIANGHGYTYHGQTNATAYPGLPYALSVPFRLFPAWHRDPQDLWIENMLMPLIAIATLALTYRALRLAAGRPTAVVVTCGIALTRTFYRSAFALMTDMPFLLGVMAFMAGYEGMLKRHGSRFHWIDATLMAGGGAITIAMRPAWLAFVPVAVLVLAIAGYGGRMNWKAVAAAGIVAILAAVLFYYADPRRAAVGSSGDQYETQVFDQFQSSRIAQLPARMVANTLDIFRQTTTSAMVGIKFGPAPDAPGRRHWYDILGAAVNIAGAAVTLGLGLALFRRRVLWGLWIVATIAMMVIVLPHERYFLQSLPLLILGWWGGLRWLNRHLPLVAGNLLFFCLAGLGFVPNFLHVCSVIGEQRRTHFLQHYHNGSYISLADAAERIDSPAIPADAIILAPDKTGRILSYLGNRSVIESNEQCDDLRAWPPPHGQHIYAVCDAADDRFKEWLASLGISKTNPINGPAGAPAGRFQLRWVPRGQIITHYQQIMLRTAAQ